MILISKNNLLNEYYDVNLAQAISNFKHKKFFFKNLKHPYSLRWSERYKA